MLVTLRLLLILTNFDQMFNPPMLAELEFPDEARLAISQPTLQPGLAMLTPHVPLQQHTISKLLVTLATLERFLPTVHHLHVYLE